MTKKILALAVAIVMVMALSVSVVATQVDLSDTFIGSNVTTGSSDELIGINFPAGYEYNVGDKVTVHFVGSSTGDFRVWLANGQTTMSPEPLFKASENGFTTGDFDFTVELEVADKDGVGQTIANGIIFKGPSYGTNLDNFSLSLVEIVDGNAAAPADDNADTTPEPDTTTTEPDTTTTEPETTTTPEPTTTTAPATGLALAVVPAVVAMAAVAVSKKH